MPRLPNHRFSMYQMRSGALIFMLSPQVKVNVEDMVFFRLWSDFSQIRTTKYSQNQCTRCHLVHWLWASEKLWALFAIDFGNSNHPRHRSWGPKPSRTLIFGIQTLTDIDLGDQHHHRHRFWRCGFSFWNLRVPWFDLGNFGNLDWVFKWPSGILAAPTALPLAPWVPWMAPPFL